MYKKIRKNWALEWLTLKYSGNPVREYEDVRSRVRVFTWVGYMVVSLIVVALLLVIAGTVLLTNYAGYLKTISGNIVLGISTLFLVLIAYECIVAFNKMYRELIEGWLRAHWHTHEFPEDLRTLKEVLNEYGSDSRYLELLMGKSPERGLVPKHVVEGVETFFKEEAFDIKYSEVESGQQKTDSRENLKRKSDVMVKFKILTEADLGKFYKDAEEKLKEIAKGELEGKGEARGLEGALY